MSTILAIFSKTFLTLIFTFVIVNVQIKGLIYAKPHSEGGPKRAGYSRVECESENYNFFYFYNASYKYSRIRNSSNKKKRYRDGERSGLRRDGPAFGTQIRLIFLLFLSHKRYILVLILAFFLKPIDPELNVSPTSYKTNLYLYITLCACITCLAYITNNHSSHNNPQTVDNKPSEKKSECSSNAPDDDDNNQVPITRKNVQHYQNNKCKLKCYLLTILFWFKKLCTVPEDVNHRDQWGAGHGSGPSTRSSPNRQIRQPPASEG